MICHILPTVYTLKAKDVRAARFRESTAWRRIRRGGRRTGGGRGICDSESTSRLSDSSSAMRRSGFAATSTRNERGRKRRRGRVSRGISESNNQGRWSREVQESSTRARNLRLLLRRRNDTSFVATRSQNILSRAADGIDRERKRRRRRGRE